SARGERPPQRSPDRSAGGVLQRIALFRVLEVDEGVLERAQELEAELHREGSGDSGPDLEKGHDLIAEIAAAQSIARFSVPPSALSATEPPAQQESTFQVHLARSERVVRPVRVVSTGDLDASLQGGCQRFRGELLAQTEPDVPQAGELSVAQAHVGSIGRQRSESRIEEERHVLAPTVFQDLRDGGLAVAGLWIPPIPLQRVAAVVVVALGRVCGDRSLEIGLSGRLRPCAGVRGRDQNEHARERDAHGSWQILEKAAPETVREIASKGAARRGRDGAFAPRSGSGV